MKTTKEFLHFKNYKFVKCNVKTKIIAFSLFIYAMCQSSFLYSQSPNWLNLPSLDSNFYSIINNAESYFGTNGYDTVPGHGYKSYVRWKDFWQSRVGNVTNIGSFQSIFFAHSQLMGDINSNSICTGGTFNEDWQYVGHTSTSSHSGGTGQGIVIKIFVDQNNDPTLNTIYIGSQKGGLWRTTNAQSNNPTWTSLTDASRYPGIGVNGIWVDPNNDANIIISTDMSKPVVYGSTYFGMGLLRSTDGGTTWNSVNSNVSFTISNPNQLITTQGIFVDPTDNDIFYVIKNNTELWKTTNGGTNFSLILSSSIAFNDFVFLPSDNNTIVISGWGALIKVSTDAGANWSDITPTGISGSDRIDLAVSKANTDLIAALVSVNQNISYTCRTTNLGSSWSKNNVTLSNFQNGAGFWYQDFEISNNNDEIYYVGGSQAGKSTNGGQTIIASYDYNESEVHPDIRDLTLFDDGLGNDVIFVATDGGVSASFNSGSTWVKKTGVGLQISEIYGFDIDLYKDRYVMGCQDLGQYSYDNGTWGLLFDWHGDGYGAIFDPYSNQGKFYFQMTSGMYTFTPPTTVSVVSLPDGFGSGNYSMEFDSKGNLYMGCGNKLYRRSFGISSWTLVKEFTGATHKISIGISKSDPNVIYVGFDEPTWSGGSCSNKLFKTTNALSGTSTWSDISSAFPANYNGITDIKVDPQTPNKVWVCRGSVFLSPTSSTADRIYYSPNGGTSWICMNKDLELSDGHPVLFNVNTMALDEATGGLYIGTDVGIFYNSDPTNVDESWVCFNNNLPIGVVTKLRIDYCQRKILASFYGRGMWESDLAESSNKNYEISNSDNYLLDIESGETQIFYSDITIPAGKTMIVEGTLKMASDRSITIKPGGKLLINGGKITSTCDLPWKGVRVEGTWNQNQNNLAYQGWVDIKNSGIIENAYEAVSLIGLNTDGTLNWHKTGGIVTANNSTFRNNRRDVEFMSYHPKVGGHEVFNKSYFNHCNFITNDENIIPNSQLEAHITMYDVSGIRISGCNFEDQRTLITYSNIKTFGRDGIHTIEGNYMVGDFCAPNQYPCSPVHSSFIKLKNGIITSGNGSKGIISVQSTTFKCYKGAFFKSTNNSFITANNFEIPHDNVVLDLTLYPFGLYLDGCNGFNIEGNKFEGVTGTQNVAQGGGAGLVIRNTCSVTPLTNTFYRSNFTSLKLGSQSLSANRSATDLINGLYFKCNDFNNNWNDLDIRNDAKSPASSGQLGIAPFQQITTGTAFVAAQNKFGNSSPILNYNINNLGSFMNYITLDPTSDSRYSPFKFTSSNVKELFDLTSSASCPNKLNSYGKDQLGYYTALSTIKSDFSQARSNYFVVVDHGESDNLIDSVDNANSTNISSVRSLLLGYSPNLSIELLAHIATRNGPFSDEIIRDIMIANPHSSRSELILKNLENRSPNFNLTFLDEIRSYDTIFTSFDIISEELSYYNYQYDTTLNAIIYSLMQDSVLNISALDTLLKHPFNPYYEFLLAEIYFKNDNFTSYSSTMDDLRTRYVLDDKLTNYYYSHRSVYNKIHDWKSSNVNIFQPDTNIRDWLLDFLDTTAFIPSPIFGLLEINDTLIYEPTVIIDPSDTFLGVESSPIALSIHKIYDNTNYEISISPNPSNSNFKLSWNSDMVNAIIRVFSINGQCIYNSHWNSQSHVINTDEWNKGVYVIEVMLDNGLKLSGKIIYQD